MAAAKALVAAASAWKPNAAGRTRSTALLVCGSITPAFRPDRSNMASRRNALAQSR
jgi:hypothetical protein